MHEPNATTRLIDQARQRGLAQIAIEEGLRALAIALGAFAILLVAGTNLFAWYWVALVATGASWFALHRTRLRAPSALDAALRLDRNLDSKDLLSTAYHFREVESRPAVDAVRRQADDTASSADANALLPIRRPATFWPMLAALLLVAGVSWVRFGALDLMDLRAPLAEVRFDTLTGQQQAAQKQTKKPNPNNPLDELPGLRVDDNNGDETPTAPSEEMLRSAQMREGVQERGQTPGKDGNTKTPSGEESKEGEDGSQGPQAPRNMGLNTKEQQGDPKGQPNQQQQGPQDKNSLMDKMRDALANLMDKMKMDSPGGDTKQASSKQSAEKKGDPSKDGQTQSSQAKSNSQGDPKDGKAGDQQSEPQQAQSSQQAQGQTAQDTSNMPRSGMGKQDGRKDVEAAKELEAMGKISELIGQRSANIEGEMMVEVTSTKNPQLRTQFTNRKAAHADTGGELSRDDVPLHMQGYVQRYYQQARKQAPASKGASQ